jgi:hypothetical protein
MVGVHELVLRVGKVVLEKLHGFVGVPGFHGAEYLLVPLQVGLVELSGVHHDVEDQTEFGEDLVHEVFQARAAGHGDKSLVEVHVRGAYVRPAFVAGGALALRGSRRHRRQR